MIVTVSPDVDPKRPITTSAIYKNKIARVLLVPLASPCSLT